ncbi:MAG: 16S rRNA (uracil(1498)-N(3))-methyltransferase [Gammaproteobacteria bacterium]|nr:16S rRNA (uracil(1498)-N(3))-methyltransferase [Gammaproteobacteria bacterium]
MRIPRIYQAGSLPVGQQIELDKTSAHHLTRVLRMQDNQPLILFNGEAGEYQARLSLQGKSVMASIDQFIDRSSESHLNITLLQGISKGERMDWCIQKAVELGVNKIVPVICQRTVVNIKGERSDKKWQHWHGIVINACEQSGRTKITQLLEPVKLTDALRLPDPGYKLTLSPDAHSSLLQTPATEKNITLLIGPEGGLEAREVEQAQASGFEAVRMGPRILRTETAAIAAITALQILRGDLG